MVILLQQALTLTDEQLQEEVTKRRDRLKLAEGQTVIGCPLCGMTKLPTLPAPPGAPPPNRVQ
jgi:hypothetical protein